MATHILTKTLGLMLLTLIGPQAAANERDEKVSIGDAPPPLSIGEMFQAGDGHVPPSGSLNWDGLKGNVVVLEFWATWCGSCVAAFPHMNELIEAFADRPVRFIAVTDEPREKVDALLATKPLNAWTALDDDGATFEAFGVRIVPHTVVVDLQGRVAAITSPGDLTEAAIEDLLAGREIDLPIKTNKTADLEWDRPGSGDLAPPLAQLIIKESDSRSGASRFKPGSGRITGDGLWPQSMFQIAYNIQPHQLDWRADENEQAHKLSVVAPNGDDDLARSMLQAVLPSMFDVTARWEMVDTEVMVLRRLENADASGLQASSSEASGGMMFGGGAELTRVTMDNFAKMLGGIGFNKTMFNETGLEGEYDINISWTPGDRASMDQALRSIGLAATPDTRPMKKLIVEPRESK